MALILAAIVFVGTLIWCLVLILANGSMAAPSMTGYSITGPLVLGTIIAALIAGSHWFPQIGW